jgi:hypothetical protein
MPDAVSWRADAGESFLNWMVSSHEASNLILLPTLSDARSNGHLLAIHLGQALKYER